MNRKHRLNPSLMAMALMATMTTVEAADAPSGTVAEVQKVGTVAKKLIINGRMPVAVVYLARYGNDKDEATKSLADKFGTTVGKIDDIKKGRNFAYVTADFRPTAEQKAAGVAWLKTHPYFDAANVDKLIVELDSITEATAEEAAAFETVRAGARGQLPTTKEGEPAAAGGGNRRAPRTPKAKSDAAPAADASVTGDALLA